MCVICVYIYLCLYVHVCVFACVCVYVHVCVFARVCVGIHVLCVCVCVCVFIRLWNYTHISSAVHERNMRIIMDFIPNHSSDQHRWFQESRKDPDGPYGDYYVWSDTQDKYRGVRIIFCDTEPSNWVLFFSFLCQPLLAVFLHLKLPESTSDMGSCPQAVLLASILLFTTRSQVCGSLSLAFFF